MSRKSSKPPSRPSKPKPKESKPGPAESEALDCEDWRLAFVAYTSNPVAALMLARHLHVLREYAQTDVPKALAAIDRALGVLFEFSEFRQASLELFQVLASGTATVEQENLIQQLGITF